MLIGFPENEAICQETMDLVQRFCGRGTRYKIFFRDNPRMVLAPNLSACKRRHFLMLRPRGATPGQRQK
jgi:hypothetical protein